MSASGPTVSSESERKYTASTEQDLPDLTGLPSVKSVDVDRVELSAQYYDTPDLRLLRSKITLRRREGGDDAGWHVKLPSGLDMRTELHFPLGDESTKVPDEPSTLLRGVHRNTPLTLTALLTTDRRRHRLRGTGGLLLAEIVVDDVTAIRGALSGPGADDDSSTEMQWREVEVEWTDALPAKKTAALLDAIDDRLRSVGIVRSDSPSKLHRVLGDRLPRPVELDPSASSLRDYLVNELHNLELADIGVRREAPDGIHSMRKAARRLRSAVQTYSGDFPLDESLIDELRWLGRRFSTSRDLEVQWERLTERVADIPVESHREATRARIDEYFSARSEGARTEAVETLDSERYLDLLGRIESAIDHLAHPPTGTHEKRDGKHKKRRKGSKAGRDSRDLSRTVEAVAKKVGKRVARVDTATDPHERDELMHRARKGAKRMRYAIEVIAPLHAKRSERALDRFDEFQDLLGEFQDSVVAREHLLDIASEQGHSAESSFGLGVLFRIEQEIGASRADHLDPAWDKALKAATKLWS